MVIKHPSLETNKKRTLSRSFRKSLINDFIEDEVFDDQIIIIPTDLLKELCVVADCPPCYLTFENNIEINSKLIHNDFVTDIVIKKRMQ